MKNILNKKALVTAVLLTLVTSSAQAFSLGNGDNNFTMLTNGGAIGGTNDVVASWDGTLNTSVDTAVANMTLSSTTPFFNKLWESHDIKVFGPGTYTFEACPDDGSRNCSLNNTPLTMTVGQGQIGAHMLFDWNGNLNIDVINVWDVNAMWSGGPNDGTTSGLLHWKRNGMGCRPLDPFADPVLPDFSSPGCQAFFGQQWFLASTDANGDGTNGTGMIDGPFGGSYANFNLHAQIVPVPAAVWLFGSGLLGLLGLSRKK